MHDLAAIRRDPDGFDQALARRGLPGVAAAVLAHDERRRSALTELQAKQERRKALSREIGTCRREGRDAGFLEAEATRLRDELPMLEREAAGAEAATRAALEVLPNLLDAGVPDGADETANVVIHQRGEPLRRSGAKQHFELGEALGEMDFEAAAKISGSRFVVLRGVLARLERVLGQFMLDLHLAEHGYTEVMVPLLVNDAAAYGTDKLPKFADELFRTTDGRWLIPTAEVPLAALAMDMVQPADRLPLRYAALSDCFRSEAGSAGRDTRGMLRQHQFRKCELVSIVAPEDSEAEHERMTRCAETVLERLDLPYRRMLLCSGDTGFGAARTYDLEVWLPGQQAWREISSCSNTRAFQARRMNARYRATGGKPDWVHTLNGSGTAVGRAMIAVMENGQQQDGSIALPLVLQPLMGGLEAIPPAR